MHYRLTSDWEEGVAALYERLMQELSAGKNVLWLLCGGSNIAPAVKIMSMISPEASEHLTLLLVDERYGPVDHPDSNCKQLIDAGFKEKRATVLSVLHDGVSFTDTRARYETEVTKAFAAADIIIAQLGIGSDGHLAGIIPESTASYETEQLVASFHHNDFDRLTMTFPALRHIQAAYIFAFGEDKKPALASLQDKDLPLPKQPAQILKELPEAYIFNDQIGEYA